MRSLPLVPVLMLVACGGDAMGDHAGSVGDIGVTVGGSQDINNARKLIEDGLIPGAGAFTPEGLFSEHDLPLAGETCMRTLCPRAAAAHIDPVDGSGGQLLVQLGFASGLEDIVRPDLDIMVALDISGSMSGANLNQSKAALQELIAQLGPDDQLGMVSFDDQATVEAPLTPMDEVGRGLMSDLVQSMATGGSTNLEHGLSTAITELGAGDRPELASPRVFLLTDAQPNIGPTGTGSFVGIAKSAAEQGGIGLTVFGVGLDLGAELASEISKLPGGNSYVFLDVNDMVERVRDEFDFMVTPLAYDLEVRGVALQDLAMLRTYGAPTDPTGDVAFGAATLFPSSRAGGMGVTLERADGSPVALQPELGDLLELSATWTELDGTQVDAAVTVTWEGGTAVTDTWTHGDDEGVVRMGGLIDEIHALEAGADWCDNLLLTEEAERRVSEAADRLAVRAADDPALQVEADLMAELLVNLAGGTGNCAL